jgi:hypothetical protein
MVKILVKLTKVKSVLREAICPGVLQYPGDDTECLQEGVFITSIMVGSRQKWERVCHFGTRMPEGGKPQIKNCVSSYSYSFRGPVLKDQSQSVWYGLRLWPTYCLALNPYGNRNIVDRISSPLVLTTVCVQFFIYLWIIPWLWRYSSASTTWNIRTVTLSFFHLLFLLTIMTFVKVNIEWPELYKVLTFALQNIPYCVTMI